MIAPVGHENVLRVLEASLSPVTLLTGPRSVGKWTIAEHLAEHHNVMKVDRLSCEKLTAALARQIIKFVSLTSFGEYKLVTIRLDGAHEASLNALLKTLEEPPATARFILICAGPTLPTIMSRAQVYRVGTLTLEELQEILTSRLGMTPIAAKRAAALGRGQVEVAIQVAASEASKPAVLAVIRALATGDRELFHKAFRSWDDTTKELLLCWMRETITGQWALFTQADSFGLDQARVRRMLLAVSRLSDARSRLGVRAALEPFLAQA